MEPPLPPLHPRVPELLTSLNLRLVDAVKWNLLACAEEGANPLIPTVVLKFGSDERKTESINYEVRIMREVLPSLDGDAFERLVLPEYLGDGLFEDVRWMKMRFVAGQPLIYRWSELTFKPEVLGGRGIDVAVADLAVDVLRDLRLVDIAVLPRFVRRFRFDEWLADFRFRSQKLVDQRLFDQATVDQGVRLFTAKAVSRYEGSMFTNGDFYPRNFILLPQGRVAVTDWVGGVDPWEFVAMYMWLMMWGNEPWQKAYLAAIKKHFPVDVEEMQVGLLVKSFDQIYRWREMPEEHVGFARSQMLAYFRQFLDIAAVRALFG